MHRSSPHGSGSAEEKTACPRPSSRANSIGAPRETLLLTCSRTSPQTRARTRARWKSLLVRLPKALATIMQALKGPRGARVSLTCLQTNSKKTAARVLWARCPAFLWPTPVQSMPAVILQPGKPNRPSLAPCQSMPVVNHYLGSRGYLSFYLWFCHSRLVAYR